MSKPIIVRIVGIALALLGLLAMGEMVWQAIDERASSVRTTYPASYVLRGVGYLIGGVGLILLRKWAVPLALSIVAICRAIDIHDAWGWVSMDGAPMWRWAIGELILCVALLAVCVWGWRAMRWRSVH